MPTPGPWTWRKNHRRRDLVSGKDGRHIAVQIPADLNAYHPDVRECLDDNARLIAAAPDLLEACKLVIACCAGNPGQCHINASGLEIVRNAIAKAEGK